MVLLEKESDAKLGISIRGGGKGSKGNPLDKNDEGIFISKVKTVSLSSQQPAEGKRSEYFFVFALLDRRWWSS